MLGVLQEAVMADKRRKSLHLQRLFRAGLDTQETAPCLMVNAAVRRGKGGRFQHGRGQNGTKTAG
ncbi:hypothetical protein SDC9_183248 [bioreactor metagenome]|uniref:Uncharacterized protein n=1 Tax=bioreactor metagenome TaxID=1076179 RepID=A0A645HCA5_9ZZZZ